MQVIRALTEESISWFHCEWFDFWKDCRYTQARCTNYIKKGKWALLFLCFVLISFLDYFFGFLSLLPHIWCIVSECLPYHLLIFYIIRLDAMKRTLAQSLTFYSKVSPESKAGESRNILEKVERKPERQHERGQHNHACNYPVDFSDRHWNQDLKRKKERDGDRKRHYCTVLCSATIIATTGSSMLWLVLHILAQKGAQTHTHAHAPGNTQPIFNHTRTPSGSFSPTPEWMHPNPPTHSNSLVCHSTFELNNI